MTLIEGGGGGAALAVISAMSSARVVRCNGLSLLISRPAINSKSTKYSATRAAKPSSRAMRRVAIRHTSRHTGIRGSELVESNRQLRSRSIHRITSDPRARNQMISIVSDMEMSSSEGESPTARHNVAATAT
jgi:hypothetical protein